MNERLWVQAPTEETIWIKNVEQKEIMECSNLPGIVACAICYKPTDGKMDFEDSWDIKIKLHN